MLFSYGCFYSFGFVIVSQFLLLLRMFLFVQLCCCSCSKKNQKDINEKLFFVAYQIIFTFFIHFFVYFIAWASGQDFFFILVVLVCYPISPRPKVRSPRAKTACATPLWPSLSRTMVTMRQTRTDTIKNLPDNIATSSSCLLLMQKCYGLDWERVEGAFIPIRKRSIWRNNFFFDVASHFLMRADVLFFLWQLRRRKYHREIKRFFLEKWYDLACLSIFHRIIFDTKYQMYRKTMYCVLKVFSSRNTFQKNDRLRLIVDTELLDKNIFNFGYCDFT